MTNYTEELQARIDEIQAANWQDIRTAANAVGVDKADDQQWEDVAETIAIAEFEQEGKPVYVAEDVEPVTEPSDQAAQQQTGGKQGYDPYNYSPPKAKPKSTEPKKGYNPYARS